MFRRHCALAALIAVSFVWFDAREGEAAPIPAERVIGIEGKKYREVDEAVAKFNEGNVEQARELLQVLVTRHPELSPPGVMMARLFLTKNQEPLARLELERTVLAQPDDPEAYELLGNLALAGRRITEADLLYTKVGELLGKLADSSRKKQLQLRQYAGLATVAESRGQWELAKNQLEQWSQLAPEDARPHLRLGQALFQLQQPDAAFAEFQKSDELAEESTAPELMMARLYEQTGQKDKAEEWVKLVVERHPDDATARVGVAETYWRDGKLDEAKLHADKALELKPDMLEAQLVRGLIARFSRDYAEAEKRFEAAHLAAPANFLAANQLALALAEQDDPEKLNRALQLAQLNGKQHPQEPEILATMGLVLIKNKRYDEAERLLRQLAGTNQMSGDAAYYLSQVLAQKKQTEEAKQLLQLALASTGPFVNRAEAQAMLESLGGQTPLANPAEPAKAETAPPSAPAKTPPAKIKPQVKASSK